MKTFLLSLLMLFSISLRAASQQILVRDVHLDSSVYNKEALIMLDEVVYALITPMGDSVVIGGLIHYVSDTTKPLNKDLVVCSGSLNINEEKIDSILFIVHTKFETYTKFLTSRGQHEIPDKTMPLPSGEVLIVREVYRRAFDCGSIVWFKLLPRQ